MRINTGIRTIAIIVLLGSSLSPAWAAEPRPGVTVLFSGPSTSVSPGEPVEIWVTALNPTDRQITWTFPDNITCHFATAPGKDQGNSSSSLVPIRSTEPDTINIAPGMFARKQYLLTVPISASGVSGVSGGAGKIVVTIDSPGANRLVLDIAPPQIVTTSDRDENISRPVDIIPEQKEWEDNTGNTFDPGQFFKDHISGYEPFYFVAGSDPALKFQISFKYQLLNADGWLAEQVPELTGLHFAYTQTSLWDVEAESAPFFDSSYKPELLYTQERVVGGQPGDWFRLDMQGGFQHESNGKSGTDSRTLNIAYLRPTLIFGEDDALQLTLQPRVWFYVGDLNENPDFADFRGYTDLRTIIGWQDSLQLSALGRIGNDGDHGSIQLDVTYPLMNLFSRSTAVYLHAQYFTGYGETLLEYNQRGSAFRLGVSIYR